MDPFRPDLLPLSGLDLNTLVAKIGRANAALASYNAHLESLSNPALLLSPLVMKEAELSSRIEGTIATAREVLEHQAGVEFESRKRDDVREIVNYRFTLLWSSEQAADRAISPLLVREMHSSLMFDVRGKDSNPGGFRERQVWVGSDGGIENATYVPPEPYWLTELMENLILHFNKSPEDSDPIVQAAILHAQFEMIHPFEDGNGRVGRMLIPLFLARTGCLDYPSFYLSAYFQEHREEYYRRLNGISQRGEWLSWIEFFLDATTVQAQSNLSRAKQIRILYEKQKADFRSALNSPHADRVLDFVFETPVFRGPKVYAALETSRESGTRFLRVLTAKGLLTRVRPASGRTGALYAFEPLLQLMK